MLNEPLLQLDLPGVRKIKSGKVREVFDLGDRLLFVATDRISAFDCIMPNGIPRKGEALTQLSYFWFAQTAAFQPNHLLSGPGDALPTELWSSSAKLAGRYMVVKKAQPLPIECVVRGYLVGSGWKEYLERQTVCGIKLPAGLLESAELPEPLFTPATKAESGHDENIPFADAAKLVGSDIAEQARAASMKIYKFAREYARQRGIIIADTKFEFGIFDSKLVLIDELLTPDSSRFWPADQYAPGRGQPSFDKQFVRDYLETLAWNKTPPAPMLPPEIVAKTQAKYLESLRTPCWKEALSRYFDYLFSFVVGCRILSNASPALALTVGSPSLRASVKAGSAGFAAGPRSRRAMLANRRLTTLELFNSASIVGINSLFSGQSLPVSCRHAISTVLPDPEAPWSGRELLPWHRGQVRSKCTSPKTEDTNWY